MTFYIPGTTQPKDTWQNSGQTILNPNPVTLDSGGRAVIYGSGSYRQVVQDVLGNLVWDQNTSEPNSGSVSFGGTSAGTANAQTLSSGSFSFVDGQMINFVAGVTNTGPMTIAIGGGFPIPVVKNGSTGPVALVANDIVSGNTYFIQYSALLSSFQLLLSVAPAQPTGLFLAGYLFGLTLSNDAADAVNDLDIATGAAASDGATPVLMSLSSILVKRLDANWVVGTNQGGLDTGSVTDATYHVFLIQRSDTGVVDVLFSLSPTAPTMPTSYDRKRRIGSILRLGSILGFRQIGGRFLLNAPSAIRASGAAVTNILVNCITPAGVRVRPILSSQVGMNAGSAGQNSIGDGDSATTTFQYQQCNSSALDTTIVDVVYTNTTQEIRFSSSTSIGTFTSNTLNRLGWWDDRGQLA